MHGWTANELGQDAILLCQKLRPVTLRDQRLALEVEVDIQGTFKGPRVVIGFLRGVVDSGHEPAAYHQHWQCLSRASLDHR